MSAINDFYAVLTILAGIVAVVGPLGAIAGAIFMPMIAIPIIKKLLQGFLGCRICIVAATAVAIGVVSYQVGRIGSYNRGVEATIAKIARNDAKLVARALEARKKLKDCTDAGHAWDQTTGNCR